MTKFAIGLYPSDSKCRSIGPSVQTTTLARTNHATALVEVQAVERCPEARLFRASRDQFRISCIYVLYSTGYVPSISCPIRTLWHGLLRSSKNHFRLIPECKNN